MALSLGFDVTGKEYAYLGHFRQEDVLRAGHNTDDSADLYNQTAEQWGGAQQAPGTTSPFGFASALGNPL
jgi:hypothetical protein